MKLRVNRTKKIKKGGHENDTKRADFSNLKT